MPDSTTAKRISPMLTASDMDATRAFYRDVLGLTPLMQSADYLIMERDGQTIHFQKAASEEVMNCVRGHAEIYIEVSRIEALWEHVKAFKLKGELTLEVEYHHFVLKAGEGIEISPGQKHQALNRSATPVRMIVTSQPPSHGDRVDA